MISPAPPLMAANKPEVWGKSLDMNTASLGPTLNVMEALERPTDALRAQLVTVTQAADCCGVHISGTSVLEKV